MPPISFALRAATETQWQWPWADYTATIQWKEPGGPAWGLRKRTECTPTETFSYQNTPATLLFPSLSPSETPATHARGIPPPKISLDST